MKSLESLKFGSNSSPSCYCIEEPNECPLCHFSIKPTKLHLHPYWKDRKKHIGVFYICSNCEQVFCSLSSCSDKLENINGVVATVSELLYIGPTRYVPQSVNPEIEDLSPQFVKIYNQALAAEDSGLDEIAGIGYRKALEFLVKDFCVHLHPDAEDEIKQKHLARCITEYIDNPQIRTLAEKAVWIGNDETHYVRKQEDRDISDMKKFIHAMVYFVGMVLIAEDADTITPA